MIAQVVRNGILSIDKFCYTLYSEYMTSHNISCIDEAVGILGDRWTPQLLRQFANNGTVRFCSMQDAVGGINPRTLSMRLSMLEERGIIEKIPTTTTRCEYRLTEKGGELLPIIDTMAHWSDKYAKKSAIA